MVVGPGMVWGTLLSLSLTKLLNKYLRLNQLYLFSDILLGFAILREHLTSCLPRCHDFSSDWGLLWDDFYGRGGKVTPRGLRCCRPMKEGRERVKSEAFLNSTACNMYVYVLLHEPATMFVLMFIEYKWEPSTRQIELCPANCCRFLLP